MTHGPGHEFDPLILIILSVSRWSLLVPGLSSGVSSEMFTLLTVTSVVPDARCACRPRRGWDPDPALSPSTHVSSSRRDILL